MYASMGALRRASSFALLLSVAVFWTASASAGIITGVTMFGPNAGTGPGLGTVAVPAIVTVMANNDNVPDPDFLDNNIFVPIKRFDFNGNIDIEFFVTPTMGVTEYQVFESVDNNTGVDWDGYRMVLGYGVGAAFVPSGPLDELDFDSPTYDLPPVSSAFTSVGAPDEDTLVFSGGGPHSSGAESYRVRIDVPDVPTFPYFSKFTLRQSPIPLGGEIPEPATLALLGIALAGIAGYRSRG